MSRFSKQLQRAYDVAEEYDKNLRADAGFNYCVRIIHEEGTIYFFENAFMRYWTDPEHVYDPKNADEYQGKWLIVFTEHQHFHVFAPGELYAWDQFQRVDAIHEIDENNETMDKFYPTVRPWDEDSKT